MLPGYRVEPFADGTGSVTPEAIRQMWLSEGLELREREARRLHEVLLVAIHDREGVVAECSAYLQRNARLGLDLWYLRFFTALEHRLAGLAGEQGRRAREHLERRYVSGEDRRGAGLATETENRSLEAHNPVRGSLTGGLLLGDNDRGHAFRVHYFEGALAPEPPA